jgi:hypothetical protein
VSPRAESWRDLLPVHPAAELFPLIGPDELRQLGEDIKENGLHVPIIVLNTGTISFADRNDRTKYALLDGRCRLSAMELVGIRFKLVWVKGRRDIGNWQIISDEISLPLVPVDTLLHCDDPYSLVASLNAHRRHLTPEGKRRAIAQLLKSQPDKSDRQVAEMVKASPTTVGTVRANMEATGDVSKLDTRRDTRGRRQPAKKGTPREGTKRKPAQPQLITEDLHLQPCPDCDTPHAADGWEQLARVLLKRSRTSFSALRAAPEAVQQREAQAQALQDVGPTSSGEVARMRSRLDELEREKCRLEIENGGLRREIQELLKDSEKHYAERLQQFSKFEASSKSTSCLKKSEASS